MITRIAYKFRLYPTQAQARALEGQLAEACRLYNAALQERRDAWRMQRKAISFYHQDRQLKDIRAAGDIGIPSFMIASNVLRRVDRAFAGFFRRAKAGEVAGYPRFRSARRYDSLEAKAGDGGFYLRGSVLHVMGVGGVRFRQHRDIGGTVKTLAVKREGHRWFMLACAEHVPQALQPTHSAIGIDVGLASFAALSDGTTVDAPQYLRKAEAKLRRAQRHVARCKRNSNRQRKARARVRNIHAAVQNRRSDFTHKLSRQIVNVHDHISVEKLNIKGLARTRLAKSIHDAGWRLFLNQLAYKAANAGREFVEVNPAGTSQTCVCGASAPKRLSDRWHRCEACGLSAPRDVVSAQVIEQRGRRLRARTGSIDAVACGGLL